MELNTKNTRNWGVGTIKNSAIIQQPIKELKASYSVVNWYKFGFNNLFPNEIALLNRTSPAHGGILDSKSSYCSGSKINIDNATDKFLIEFLKYANNEGKSAWNLAREFFGSFDENGNVWLEIVTNKKRNFLNLFVRDYTTVRLGRNELKDNALIYPDWESLIITSFDKVTKIPLYPNFTEIDGNLHSMLHIKRTVAGFPVYGLPRWLSALDAAEIGKGVNVWNKMRVKKGFSSDGAFEAEFNTPDEATECEDKFNKKKAGDENAGNVIFIKKAAGASSPANFVPFNRTSEGEFLQLRNLSVDDLVMAHGWFRALCSLPDNTGFDTQRIINEYDIAKANVIFPAQNFFISVIDKLFKEMFNIDTTGQIQFINKPPVKTKEIWKLWELRRDEGLDYDENDPAQQVYYSQKTAVK